MAVEMVSTIKIDSSAVRAMLKTAPEKIHIRLNQLIQIGAIDTQREMRQRAPVGATGDLRRQINYHMGDLKAEIVPEAKYSPSPDGGLAGGVETGTRPHWVSVKQGTSLFRWAQMKGIPPYALQRSIAQKGTKAHPFALPTFNFMKPRVEETINRGISQLISELN